MAAAITYTPDTPIEGRRFTCKRCQRVYAYPEANDRPIRCECGWWYYNDGAGIRESYQQRLEPYRTPANLRTLFERR
ncbi:MAG TPA: hypothetical protein VGF98_05035 [Candidatus Tumulicola sp.]|jgi:hypothetical protein